MTRQIGRTCFFLIAFLAVSVAVPALRAAISVTLNPSIPGQAPVGAVVTWVAVAEGGGSTNLWYRFRSRSLNEGFHLVRDFGPSNVLRWTASEHEGPYEIEVIVRDRNTGISAGTSVIYQVSSRITGTDPVISATENSLVFVYSAPGCPEGSRMRVQFRSDDAIVQNTPPKDCRPDVSMNFYLAGMRSNAQYSVKHIIDNGEVGLEGPGIMLTTPDVPLSIAGYTVYTPPPVPANQGILLQSTFSQITVATDLSGNVVWYYPEAITYLTRPAPGGYFYVVVEDPSGDASTQVLRKIDLAGNAVLETNAARVSEQLAAWGKRRISSFHHEASELPGGKTLALATVEQILTDVQGPGPVDVLGDMILVLDSDMQLLWAWDAFDYLDPARMAILQETCSPAAPGCAPFFLAGTANDWLHGNSVQLTPDGNLIYSARHQDWLIKIAYDNGQGSGNIIWRLGKDGDFQIRSSDPSPWFSHQHDAGFEPGDGGSLMLFDNGNTRHALDYTANSRCQVLHLDEQNRVATFVLNADVGAFSPALGSAQKLTNGSYHFNAGWMSDGSSISVEVDPLSRLAYMLGIGTLEYRTFRMQDLYTP